MQKQNELFKHKTGIFSVLSYHDLEMMELQSKILLKFSFTLYESEESGSPFIPKTGMISCIRNKFLPFLQTFRLKIVEQRCNEIASYHEVWLRIWHVRNA